MDYIYETAIEPTIAHYSPKVRNPQTGQWDGGELDGGITYDIWYGDMEDKDVHCIKWENGILKIRMADELSTDDKDKLDIIVENNIPS